VARGTQHRKRRPRQNARGNAAVVAAPPKHHQRPPQWQEELFFQRLRNHAKAIFFLLALVFALSFVFLGVGSGSNGVSDALQSLFTGHGSSGPSISSLEKKTQKDPLDAKAWRDLATAYETKQRTNDAIDALAQYVGLKSGDTGALAELGSLYTQQAQGYATDYTNAQQEVASATPAAEAFAPASTTTVGKLFNDANALKDPISAAVQTLAQAKESTAYSNYQTSQANAESTYQKLAKATPKDPNAQIQLGQAASAATDYPTAIAAYEKFLKLAPNDPLTGQVKTELKTLKAQAAVSSPSSSSK
jgi:cytochrome c-type biogenesis protein CcmH/NrfG